MTELREIIKEQIRKQGRITFADFMDMALYYPELGYYTSSRERVGVEGDFYTSPATHPVFAALISRQLEQIWQLMDCPPDFTILEMGAGKGLLAKDILSYLSQVSPRFAGSLIYIAEEKGGAKILFGANTGLPEQITGCVISNELLDALPVHKIVVSNGQLQEIYVTVKGDEFVEVAAPPSTTELEEQLSREEIRLPEGYSTEINLNIGHWMKQVAARLEKGFVITIDYGYLSKELYAPERSRGTLVTYYRHTCATNPYIRIGEQDITSHADFTTAILAGEHNGVRLVSFLNQRDFLLNLGIDLYIQALAEKRLDHAEYLASHFAMLELVRPAGMGAFKVLVQSKELQLNTLYGMMPDNQLKDKLKSSLKGLNVPLLSQEHIPLFQAKYPQYSRLDNDIW